MRTSNLQKAVHKSSFLDMQEDIQEMKGQIALLKKQVEALQQTKHKTVRQDFAEKDKELKQALGLLDKEV